jgi:hypothetical protein
VSEYDQKRQETIDRLMRKALAGLPPEQIADWNKRRRRDLGFIGYGRGSQRDSYRRGLRHVRYAIDRLAEAGPEYATAVEFLKALEGLIPPFTEK